MYDIRDIKCYIERPDFQSMTDEESMEWAIQNFPIAVKEMQELNDYLNKIPYRTTAMDESIAEINFAFQNYANNQYNSHLCNLYTIAIEFSGQAIMRGMFGYYYMNYTPIEHIYPKLRPICEHDQRWIEMERKKEKQLNSKNNTNNTTLNYNRYVNLVGAPEVDKKDHKILGYDGNNKIYPKRPMKYQSLHGLWFLIPISIFLFLLGPGGLIFSIFMFVAYFKYEEKQAQEIWERDCDFYEMITPKSTTLKNPMDFTGVDLNEFENKQ